jgi:hypothetical protein
MRFHRAAWVVAAVVVFGGRGRAGAGERIPEPRFDRVKYDKPAEYTALLPTMGKKAAIEKAAAEVRATTFEGELAGAKGWVEKHLRYDEHAAYAWRDFDQMLADGTYGGCADHALAVGCVTRALGIPTVWVKTMDADWIHEFKTLGEGGITAWSGHVFLEVHDGKRWLLFNATQGILHDDYDPKARLLPGTRLAYDKGGDPFALVLSTRWEDWKEQTRAYFAKADLSMLPLAGGRELVEDPAHRAYVAGTGAGWERLVERYKAAGWTVGRSGNGDFATWLPWAKGRTLVIASVGGSEILPAGLRSRYLPKSFAEMAKEHGRDDSFVERRTLDDGTRVVAVYGRTETALASAIASLDPNAK